MKNKELDKRLLITLKSLFIRAAANPRLRRAAVVIGVPFMIFLFLNFIFPLPKNKLFREESVAVYSKNGDLLTAYLASDGRWRIKTELKDVPVFMRRSVMAYEDKWFRFHPGFNFVSFVKAAVENRRHGKIVRGGSTLTMQVARMMERRPRTYGAKIIELFRAFQLEFRYSKNQILEIYFNLAPYGGNLEGLSAAAYFYFGKGPEYLSRSEMISLIGLPNSPTRLRPDRNFDRSQRHRKKIAGLLLDRKIITKKEYADLSIDEMPRLRMSLPQNAPHFSLFVKQKNPRETNITSTLDMRIQRTAESLLARHLSPLIPQGITNGAIVVIENKTRAVRAMVGSRDFYDRINAGQVNGATSPRSPGSTLKPLMYALALDNGVISPKLILADVPISYSGYSPVNYDERYHGGVAAEDALKQSLNVPAVNLYAALGSRFFNLLKRGGITSLTKPMEYYGLPLILGSGDMTLIEMTNLYATLATDGKYRDYKLIETEKPSPERRLYSDAAAFIISRTLSEIRRPDLPNCWEFTVNLPKVAWKTGTSYGHHDAWSIGYNPDYTVGVWIGNFNNRDAEKLIGAEVAAPLLFDIFNSITDASDWFDRPATVGTRKVCSVSGMVADDNCPGTVDELFIYGVSPSARCNMHKKFIVDDTTGKLLSPACTFGRTYHEKTFTEWPARIATWRKREGYPVDDIPPYLKDCGFLADGAKPLINSPQPNTNFYLRPDAPPEHQKILLDASVSNTVDKIFWLIDGNMIAEGKPTDRNFYYPTPGKHRIVCMDSEGRSSEVKINVY